MDQQPSFNINIVPEQLRLHHEAIIDLSRRVIALEKFKCHCKQGETLKGIEARLEAVKAELASVKVDFVHE